MTEKTFSEVLEYFRLQKKVSKKNLAERAGLTPGYVSHLTLGNKEPSTKVVISLSRALNLNKDEANLLIIAAGYDPSFIDHKPETFEHNVMSTNGSSDQVKRNFDEMPKVQVFIGRHKELKELEKRIVDEASQIEVIYGMGGIGKTALAVKLVELVSNKFEYVLWLSLKNAPAIEDVLSECLSFFSNQTYEAGELSIDQQINQLTIYLRTHHCLLIFDNFESFLRESQHEDQLMGHYKEGHKHYSELLRQLGETNHQSCLLLTSREKPAEFTRLEGYNLHVRSFRLLGFNVKEGFEIIKTSGLQGSEQDFADLIQKYSGNPLALKMVSQYILELFNGHISGFLQTSEFVFDDIEKLLEEHFHRLSPRESEILYWLAIHREHISFQQLKTYFVYPIADKDVFVAISSLHRRSLIETDGNGEYSLQPVVMEYALEQFIAHIATEIQTESFKLFDRHALLIAQSKDYIRRSQIDLILDQLIQRLLTIHSKTIIEDKLKKLLQRLRESLVHTVGYSAGNILNLLIRLETNLDQTDFSTLTIRQAYLQHVNVIGINFTQVHFLDCAFMDTFGSVFSLALSSDGKLIAIGTANSEIRLWSTTNDRPLLTFRGHTDWIRSIAFSPDGQLLASGSEDKTIRLWDVKSGECLRIFKGHTNRVSSVTFDPSGQHLVSGGEDTTIYVWNRDEEVPVSTFQGHQGKIHTIRFNPDGNTFVSSGEDGSIALWNIHTGKHLLDLKGHTASTQTVRFSPDGKHIMSGSDDTTIRIWDTQTGECQRIIPVNNKVLSLALSPDGRTIASASNDSIIHLWDTQTGKLLRRFLGHTNWVSSVAFTPDGNTLVSGSDDKTLRLWEVATGRCVRIQQGHTYWVYAIAFSPDGNALASAGDEQSITLWNIHAGSITKTFPVTSKVRCLAFHPNGALMVSGSDDAIIRLWDIHTGRLLRSLEGHSSWVRSLVFSHDGNTLISSSEDHSIRFWDIHTGKEKNALKEHKDWVYTVALHPNGNLLASGSGDTTVRLWDFHTGTLKNTFVGHTDKVCSVAFHPKGELLASSSADTTIRIWNIHTGKEIQRLEGHTDWIFSIAISPDGTKLVSGSDDNTVRVWDLNTYTLLHTLAEHSSWIYSVAFSPDGSIIASGSDDGTCNIWETLTGRHLCIFRRDRPYERMNITGALGLTDPQRDALIALGAFENF